MRQLLLGVSLVILSAPANGAETDRAGLEFFEAKIRPVLVESCYECHSAQAAGEKKLKGGLLLDTRQATRQGGESGPAVVPGKVEESLLISALRHDAFEMPPKGKLDDTVIANFVKWIEMGAPDPRDGQAPAIVAADVDVKAGRQLWVMQPLADVTPPDVKDAAWVRTPVDRFVRAKQEAASVQPNGVAAARTLIRRACYDLTGLPPKPEEVAQFVAEAREDMVGAYARLVDRLLASDRYGERWARHWLDLARFAESNGYAFDKDRPNAHQYRDFVIRALNADMPYDEFVRRQIAGDLLNPQDLDSVAATGFLVAGPFTTQQTQKERERSRYEQLDDMVHTLGTSLLGLTLGCARCHSHKYDPVPQYDYYRLASCFADVGFADVGLDLHPEIYREAKAQFDAAHAPLLTARTELEQKQLPARFAAWLENRPRELPEPVLEQWHHIGPFAGDNFDKAYDQSFPPETERDLQKTYQDGRLKWTPQPKWDDGKVHNTLTGVNAANYLLRVIESPAARKIALSLGSDDAIRVWLNGKEVLAKKIGRGAAPDQEKIEVPLRAGRNELLIKIVNGAGPSGFYFKASADGVPPEVAALLKMPPDQWKDSQRKKVVDWYKTQDEQWLKLDAAVAEHAKQEPKPKLTMIYAAKVRGTTYNFGADTYKVYFLRRGNADNKEGVAPPGFLQVLMPPDEKEQPWLTSVAGGPPDAATTANTKPARVALADWLTDTRQGAGHLLARVMVNRLWNHHFGRGIVATPSDFGTRGEQPSHPELLDWLAGELVRGGWKLKPLHRLIMTSAVYMQGGEATDSGPRNDPENLLLWRRWSRRLEAETVRDALLAVSGSLDTSMYGAGSLDQRTPRRSIYLTVKRSQLIPMLQFFDAPDTMQGIGRREESTVAPQALTLLNSPLVRELAAKFAQRARPDEKTSLGDAVDRAYQFAFARPASDQERAHMLAFIQQQTELRGGAGNAEALALRDFCHVLLCMNEFVYVD